MKLDPRMIVAINNALGERCCTVVRDGSDGKPAVINMGPHYFVSEDPEDPEVLRFHSASGLRPEGPEADETETFLERFVECWEAASTTGTLEKSHWLVRWVWAEGIMKGQAGKSQPFLVEEIARAMYDDYVTRPHIRNVEMVRHDVTVLIP
jgi:hypothetical protein